MGICNSTLRGQTGRATPDPLVWLHHCALPEGHVVYHRCAHGTQWIVMPADPAYGTTDVPGTMCFKVPS